MLRLQVRADADRELSVVQLRVGGVQDRHPVPPGFRVFRSAVVPVECPGPARTQSVPAGFERVLRGTVYMHQRFVHLITA